MDKRWSVYIVKCKNGALYTGITTDIEKRIKQHNIGTGAKSLRALGRPVRLLWNSIETDKSHALKLECFIKSLCKKEKERIIARLDYVNCYYAQGV